LFPGQGESISPLSIQGKPGKAGSFRQSGKLMSDLGHK